MMNFKWSLKKTNKLLFRNKKIIKVFLSWDLNLETNASSELLKKKLANILSGEADPLALRQDSLGII